MSTPAITVLMPAYNVEKYIGEAIASVLVQTFSDFELLIINDGSTDSTLEVINSFTDPRIRAFTQHNQGVAAALNVGLQLAKAPWIARFDADDVCYPGRLQIQYDFITTHPDYAIIGGETDYMDERGEYVFTHKPEACSYDEIKALPLQICPFIHSSTFYSKASILAHGGYNELAYSFEDHLLWARILHDEKACNLPRPLIKVRLNPGSITIDERWRTPEFRKIKYKALATLNISTQEGKHLKQIAATQQRKGINHSAYHALLAKKYLWNNYSPAKARQHLLTTVKLHPLGLESYLMLLLSCLPKTWIICIYNLTKNGGSKPGLN